MWLGIIALINKVLDFITPWSTYWVGRRKARNEKKEAAQKKMDEAAKTGDADAYWNDRADKHSA